MKHPEPIRRLIDAFLVLPGIGRRTAERFAYSLMQGRRDQAATLATAIGDLHRELTTCARCGQFSEISPCAICANPERDQTLLCIVADSRNIVPIEQTGEYKGLYFTLGGTLNPVEGMTAGTLRIQELQERLREGLVREIILAFNVDATGEATTLFLKKTLAPFNLRLTRPARGLPTGSQLEYADEVTLGSALANRREA